ncbi:MAG TPA: DUF4352 domain-containing protein [Candidatus Saccharimonadales bacterium]|nr:DUF4352 domain-containing protein [Candidatus Saccharimonadales bacterium]
MKDQKSANKNWFARHKVLTVVLAFVVIGVIAAAAGGGKSNTPTSSNSATKSSDAASTAKLGQAARDGKFEFLVNSVKCGEVSIGSQYLNKTAQGQFCRLNLTVKNIGNEAQSLDSRSQYLFNAAGQKYAADGTATLYAEPSGASSTWYNDVNPGNSVTGDIIFDVPKDQTPATAELHDSAFSGGVKVNLQ